MLNRLVPELTRHMISNIFATDIEDWLALARAMRETGEQFRQGKFALPQMAEAAPAGQGTGMTQQQAPPTSMSPGHK